MTESESVALPFGDTPMVLLATHKILLYTLWKKNQEKNKKFLLFILHFLSGDEVNLICDYGNDVI